MTELLVQELNPLVRFAGVDDTAAQVLERALDAGELPITARGAGATDAAHDYAQIDPALHIETAPADAPPPPPHPSLSYGGYTPQQRYQLLHWLQDPTAAAPPGFQQLYVAHLEVHLLEGEQVDTVQRALVGLQMTPAWGDNVPLQRAILLSFWLRQDADAMQRWLVQTSVSDEVLALALGHLALLGAALSPELLALLLARWHGLPAVERDVLALRLASLEASLGAEPLAHALDALGAEAREPQPWRCAHRDLRIALPQPDLRPALEPLLAEIAEILSSEAATELALEHDAGADDADADDADGADPGTDIGWHLVLEFGHSRSDFFEFVLARARKRPGYSQLMDEDRNLIYRVVFRKRELRHFWPLWDSVQSWTSTRIYVNGQELEKWKVWPYSQYLR